MTVAVYSPSVELDDNLAGSMVVDFFEFANVAY